MSFSIDDYKWLALGLLKSKEVLSTACDRLQLEDFKDSELVYKILFKIAHDWYKQYSDTPSSEFVIDQLTTNQAITVLLKESDSELIVKICEFVYKERTTEDTKKLESFLFEKLQQFLNRKIQHAATKLMRPGSDLRKGFSELERVVASTAISQLPFLNPFAGDSPEFGTSIRKPWNIDFVDMITDGGSDDGETVLFLGPTGGGKTLVNIQLAIRSALDGNHSVICSYELGKEDLYKRLYACAMGIPVRETMGEDSAQRYKSNAEYQRRFKEIRERLIDNLTVVDMLDAQSKRLGGNGGAPEIRTIIKKLQDAGKPVRYVGIDWLEPMWTNFVSNGPGRQLKNYETKANGFLQLSDDLRKVGAECKTNIWIYHQLGTEGATRKGFTVPDHTDARDCKGLGNYMSTVICVGPRDPVSNVAVMGCPKVRNGQRGKFITVKMEGALSKFVMAQGAVISRDKKSIILVDDASAPVEQKPQHHLVSHTPSGRALM